ncbi:MAG TPA: substrate-binding and VWA domain-containing protein [Streptosporangiaceae bacterium]|nr:substrate-binding and VWA domain-containing protein [Streptosporangiaceae bacterium]
MALRAAGSGRRERSRRIGTAKLLAVAIAVSALCMVTLTAKAVITRADCSDTPVLVNVAVSYDIAPAIETVAQAFNNQNVTASGHCVQVQVTEGDPATQASQIDGQAALGGLPTIDAWIPDSSVWVDMARSYPLGAENVQPTGKSVARSPLMLVTTAAVAAKTHIFDSPPGWNVLLPPSDGGPPASLGLAVDLPDPTDSSAGLATLIEVSRRLGDSAAARAGFTQFVLRVESTEDFDSLSGLQQFVASTQAPFFRQAVTVASEQAVIAYDKATPKAPLDARYPTGPDPSFGSPELDYPYVLTTSKARALQAAAEFGTYLQSSYARSVIRYYGFRSSDGVPDVMPASAGLSSQPLQVATAATATQVASNLQAWEKLGLGSRDLALIDVSPAMAEPDGDGTQTLHEELNQTAARGLALFPNSTSMGLWEMGAGNSVSKPYTQLVSIGPLTADYGVITRRSQLQELTGTLPIGHGTLPLHAAILDAYREMTQTYLPNYSNAVLVLTAGVDSARHDLSLSSLVTKLRALYNPSKKVELVILMFGQQGNFAALQQIANATGGVAYQVANPASVGKIFIEAVSQRMCTQGCAQP